MPLSAYKEISVTNQVAVTTTYDSAGVGKVREENPETGAVTELSSYEIP
jgi:hypothetical protein